MLSDAIIQWRYDKSINKNPKNFPFQLIYSLKNRNANRNDFICMFSCASEPRHCSNIMSFYKLDSRIFLYRCHGSDCWALVLGAVFSLVANKLWNEFNISRYWNTFEYVKRDKRYLPFLCCNRWIPLMLNTPSQCSHIHSVVTITSASWMLHSVSATLQ